MSWPKSESGPLPFRCYSTIPGSPADDDGKPGPRALVFSLQHRPRATRASVPKVRSGCITCKRRHVKCDEAKPSCNRCLKWQGVCEGYAAPGGSSKRDRSRSPASSVASKGSRTSRDSSRTPPPCKRLSGAEHRVSTLDKDDPLESQRQEAYLSQWLAISNNLAGGWFPTTLFTETIPDLGRTEPAVHYAMVAVCALASAVAPNAVPNFGGDVVDRGAHYNHAINYYSYALRLVRLQQDVGADRTLGAIMINCILFACFEALHDCTDAAIKHINYGLVLLEQFPCTAGPAPGPEGGARCEGSPESFQLDEEIFAVFRRLECLSCSSHLLQRIPASPRIHQCPVRFSAKTPFTDVLVARKQLDLALHETTRMVLAENARRAGHASDGSIDPELLGKRDTQNLKAMEVWRVLFEPFYDAARASRSADPQRYFQATLLLLENVSSWVVLRTASGSDDSALRALTPHFKEIVHLSSVLLEDQPKPEGCTEVFTMSHGPALGLTVVATKCPDPRVRADATMLLDRHPRRDAFWDSRAISRALEVKGELRT